MLLLLLLNTQRNSSVDHTPVHTVSGTLRTSLQAHEYLSGSPRVVPVDFGYPHIHGAREPYSFL